MTTPQKEPRKVRDLPKVIAFLTNSLNRLTHHLPRAHRDPATGEMNRVYQLQSEMAHYINEIEQGPACMQQHYIAAGNEIIDQLLQEQRENRSSRRRQTQSK